MLFSIIVPVYNVEAYIDECIQSVLNQSFKDFELILVDDGSPDQSGEICDYYSLKDKRIKVIHQKNGGLSNARNTGIDQSKGQYLLFLDSDDYLVEDILTVISKYLLSNNKPDLISCAKNYIYSNNEIEYKLMEMEPHMEIVTKNVLYEQLTNASEIYWSAWGNVFKKEIIDENELRFDEEIIGAEDCSFFIDFIIKSTTFSFVDYPIVNYRVNREGSITNVMSKKAIYGQLVVFQKYYYLFKNKNEKMENLFAQKFANTIYLLSLADSKDNYDECIKYILKNKEVMKSARGLKYNFSKIIWRILGYKRGSDFLHKVNCFFT